MIGVVRRGKARIFLGAGFPVKVAAVHDAAAYGHGMAVHIFRGGMRYNVRPPLKGTTVNGRCKGIVYDKRNLMAVGQSGKFFNIQNHKGRICDRLSKNRFRIWSESFIKLFFGSVRVYQSTLNAKAL